MSKIEKKCQMAKNKVNRLIHIKNPKKGGKIEIFIKLFTLST